MPPRLRRAKSKPGKDAGSARTNSTGATEDAAWRRFAAAGGDGGHCLKGHLVRDGDRAALAARRERDLAVATRKDRVVAPETDARPRAEARAALADEDHPGLHVLAGEDLHSEHLRVRVAPVARGAESLLVRHLPSPSSVWEPPPASAWASASRPRPSASPPPCFRSTRSRSGSARSGSRSAAGSPSADGTCRSPPSRRAGAGRPSPSPA